MDKPKEGSQKDTAVVLDAFVRIAEQFGLTMDMMQERVDELAKLMDWLKRCGESGKKKDVMTTINEFYQAFLGSRPMYLKPGIVQLLEEIRQANERITKQSLPATIELLCEQVRKRADFLRLFVKSNLPVEMLAGMMMYWPNLHEERITHRMVEASN